MSVFIACANVVHVNARAYDAARRHILHIKGMIQRRFGVQGADDVFAAQPVGRLALYLALHQYAPRLHVHRIEDGRGVAHQDLHFLAPRAGHQRFRAQKHLRLLRSQRLFRFERLPGQIHIHSASLPVVHDSIFGEFLAYSPLAMPPDF